MNMCVVFRFLAMMVLSLGIGFPLLVSPGHAGAFDISKKVMQKVEQKLDDKAEKTKSTAAKVAKTGVKYAREKNLDEKAVQAYQNFKSRRKPASQGAVPQTVVPNKK